jgi:acyl-CoA synthetase (AMP-forming)/AMP-acid ligase II
MTVGEAQLEASVQVGPARANVASLIEEQRRLRPEAVAVIEHATGRRVTFGELGQRIENIAFGLTQMGICDGARTVLAVKPGIEFVELVFALFRARAVPVVVDPGMGKALLLKCVEEAQPSALVGIPLAHALSLRYRKAFRTVKQRVTVGRRWLWGGSTYRELASRKVTGSNIGLTLADSTAAILYTSGATGAPKGVVYHHGIFVEQVRMIREAYGIEPGEIDVPCFALFALFSVAMGVTIVLPDMDFSRPGKCDPAKIVAAINQHKATMSFGSPAVWRLVGPHLLDNSLSLPSVKRILIAGAPVPHATLAMFKDKLAIGGDLHTPYGATESLPLSTISAGEVLAQTRFDTMAGAGTCVGRPLPGVEVKVIRQVDGPVSELIELKQGEIGEIIVRSAVTTREYFNRPENTRLAKIGPWHRMGDMGYFDGHGRLWFTGRVNHRVETTAGALYPIQCEAIFNNHDAVSRSALVGLGDKPNQTPLIVIELHDGHIPDRELQERIRAELLAMAQASDKTREIKHVLFHTGLPLDTRHNAKIDRGALAQWAETQLPEVGR